MAAGKVTRTSDTLFEGKDKDYIVEFGNGITVFSHSRKIGINITRHYSDTILKCFEGDKRNIVDFLESYFGLLSTGCESTDQYLCEGVSVVTLVQPSQCLLKEGECYHYCCGDGREGYDPVRVIDSGFFVRRCLVITNYMDINIHCSDLYRYIDEYMSKS